jgi:predicted nicotinamide N-methyase
VDDRVFVVAHTRLQVTPFVPEVHLHLASEPLALWALTEQVAGGPQPLPFWAFPWGGGQALARHILDHPALVRGRRVVDVAAGSGLVAIAAALAGAATVTACDIDERAVAAIGVNAAANGVAVRSRLGDPLHAVALLGGGDVVLAGDVCYSPPMANRMLRCLVRAHAHGALSWSAIRAAGTRHAAASGSSPATTCRSAQPSKRPTSSRL